MCFVHAKACPSDSIVLHILPTHLNDPNKPVLDTVKGLEAIGLDVLQALEVLKAEVSQGTDETMPGLVRGQRFNQWWGGYVREENNIFFGLTVAYVLQRMAPAWSPAMQQQVSELVAGLRNQLHWFTNPHDHLSVNYWPRFPAGHFPNGKFYHLNPRFKAPDDIDDTGYALSLWGPDLIDVEDLTNKVIPYCQGVTRKNGKTPPVLAKLPAYNTWMGHHMAVDVDVCVLANYLPPVLALRKDLNLYDVASLDFLVRVVEEKWYQKIPHLVCGYYLRIPIMAYHLARNLNLLPDPWASKIKAALLRDWDQIMATVAEPMHYLVLDSAALYLGISDHMASSQVLSLQQAMQPYTCYYMGMVTPLDYAPVNAIAHYGLFQVRKRCLAFNVALWLENRTLHAGYRPGPFWWS